MTPYEFDDGFRSSVLFVVMLCKKLRGGCADGLFLAQCSVESILLSRKFFGDAKQQLCENLYVWSADLKRIQSDLAKSGWGPRIYSVVVILFDVILTSISSTSVSST